MQTIKKLPLPLEKGIFFGLTAETDFSNGSVAQWIEQQPSKLWVMRSNRIGITNFVTHLSGFCNYPLDKSFAGLPC